jgi:hypothetical protein
MEDQHNGGNVNAPSPKARYTGSNEWTIRLLCVCSAVVWAERVAWRAAGSVSCESCKRRVGRDLMVSE